MKKLKYFSLISLIAVFMFMLLTSCQGQALQAPHDLNVDLSNKLTWSKISDAKSYVIDITGLEGEYENEVTLRKTSYSLAKLEEGDYVIKVKAIPGEASKKESEWSEDYSFHKDYESGCIYTLINNNSEYEITKAGSASGKVIIEDTYRGKPVTKIADNAFKSNGRIESVVIGNNVTSIGDNAFYNCPNVTSITLPTSLKTLGKAAFQSCRSLTSIEIPSGVTVIEDDTFAYCRSLTSAKLSDNIVSIGENAFTNCSALVSVTLPEKLETLGDNAFLSCSALEIAKINKNLKVIPQSAFEACVALRDLTFAENSSLTEIGYKGFYGCTALTSVALPEGLEKIGAGAFMSCGALETVTIPTSVIKVGVAAFVDTTAYSNSVANDGKFIYIDNWVVGYDETNGALTQIKSDSFKAGVVGIADYAFRNQFDLVSVTLVKTIKSIGERSFAGCSVLWQFKTAKNSLVYIWDYAFNNCPVLSQVELKEGLEYIGGRAFFNCSLVMNNEYADPIVPSTVKHVGTYAFYKTGLWNEADEYGIIYAGNWVVGSNGMVSNVTLKSDTIGVSDYAFYNNTNIRTIAGLNNAKYIGYAAFYGCENLKTVILNTNIKTIEDYTFYGCSSLFNITMPINLTSIGEYAFYNCATLNEVLLANTKLTSIGANAFKNCININTITLPKTLETISDRAFYNDISLKSIELPDSVTSIGEYSFYLCASLTSVKFGTGITNIPQYAFAKCINIESIVIPGNVKTIEKSAFFKCFGVLSLTLEEGVESVAEYSFFGFEKVETLILPSSLVNIGNYAFKGYTALTSLVIPADIKSIGLHAFYGAKNATIYTNATEKPESWQAYYNSSFRPVVYGCELSDDNTYVVSVTITDTTFANKTAKGGFAAPLRKGYTFGGWSATIVDEEGVSKTVTYTAEEIVNAPVGTKLTAIWNAK